MKKHLVIILAILLIFTFTGCGSTEQQGSKVVDTIKSFIKGDVAGELNKSYSTQWFDFTVKSIKTAYNYGGYDCDEGYKFVVVTVIETNTFDEPIPMGTFDFHITADGLSEDDSIAYEAWVDSMMPDEFYLEVGETVEYDVVFGIPDEIMEIGFVYIEIDENDGIGATFTIKQAL